MLMKARKTATEEKEEGPTLVKGWGKSRSNAPPKQPEPSNDEQVRTHAHGHTTIMPFMHMNIKIFPLECHEYCI